MADEAAITIDIVEGDKAVARRVWINKFLVPNVSEVRVIYAAGDVRKVQLTIMATDLYEEDLQGAVPTWIDEEPTPAEAAAQAAIDSWKAPVGGLSVHFVAVDELKP
jgi:hypothetical protein